MTTLTAAPRRNLLSRLLSRPLNRNAAPQSLRAPQFMESLEPRLVLSSPLTLLEPTVRINPIQVTLGEKSGVTYIVATRTAAHLAADLNVSFNLAGSASLGSDYLITSADGKTSFTNSFTFKAGVAVTILKVQSKDDSAIEGSESISFSLAAGANYQLDVNHSASITIADSEPTVKILTPPVVIQEKAGVGYLTIARLGGNLFEELDVPFTLAGSASLGTDFKITTADGKITLTDSFTFKAGAATTVLKIQAIDDASVEGFEQVTLSLGKAGSFGLDAKSSQTVTIVDNEPTVKLNPLNVSINENLGFAVVVASRIGSLTDPLTVNFGLAGSAAFGADYKITSMDGKTTYTDSFTFKAGAAVTQLKIQALDDSQVEGSENVSLTLQAPSVGVSYGIDEKHSVSINITDNEPTVKLNPVVATISEGLGFTTIVATRVGGNIRETLDVSFALSGSASLGTDFKITSADGKTAFSNSFTFKAGVSAMVLKVQAIDDAGIENSETVGISIVAGPGVATYNIDARHNAVVTITDNEPVVKLSPLGFTLGEAGKFALITATRVGGNLREDLDVSFALAGSATIGSDYKITSADGKTTYTSGFTFKAGAAVTVLKVQAIDDTIIETNETATLTLTASGGAAYSLDAKSSVSVTLLDDEPVVRLFTVKSTASENLAAINKGLITLTRSTANLLNPLDVEFTISGDADLNTDYQLRSLLLNKNVTTEVRGGDVIGKVTFPRGISVLNFSVTANPDKDATEGTEDVVLKLVEDSTYTVDDSHDEAHVDILDGKSISLNVGHIGSSLKITTQASLSTSISTPGVTLTTVTGAALSATGRDAAYTYTYLSAGGLVNRITLSSVVLSGLPLESASINLNFTTGRPASLLGKTILFLPTGTVGADGTFNTTGLLSAGAQVSGAFRLV